MAVDISHCSDRTTLDALNASRKPVLVTHSNCRALVAAALAARPMKPSGCWRRKGGVIGITMVRGFVQASGPATIEDVLDHIDHVARLVGVEHVGIGTDVDLEGRDARMTPQALRSGRRRLFPEDLRPYRRVDSAQVFIREHRPDSWWKFPARIERHLV